MGRRRVVMTLLLIFSASSPVVGAGATQRGAVGRVARLRARSHGARHAQPGVGVSAGVGPGTTVALKNGWCNFGSGWNINSIGWIHRNGRDYVIAVTTFGNPTENYGIDSISEVAVAAWNALGVSS